MHDHHVVAIPDVRIFTRSLAAGYVFFFWLVPDPGGAMWRVLGGSFRAIAFET